MTDLHYTKLGIFTMFMPNTKDGENIWRELASRTEGTGKVFTMHLASTLKQIRAAGYSVSKAPKSKPSDFDDMLLEFDQLFPAV